MSRDTEKMFRELDEFMKQFGEVTEEQAKEKINEFVAKWNNSIGTNEPAEKDQWYYLELAMDAENEKIARKNAQRALSIDPYCTDAEALLIELMDITMEEEKKRIEKLIKKTEEHLKEEGYFEDENIGHFYGIHQTRPYMRVLGAYMEVLIGMGKFSAATRLGEKIIKLNENDNLGTRYDLMALYAFQENLDAAENLHKAYPEDSVSMLLPFILIYYKLDEYTKARRYLKQVVKANPDFKKFMNEEMSDEEIESKIMPNGFVTNSIGEVMDVFDRDKFLIGSTLGGMLWISGEMGKM